MNSALDVSKKCWGARIRKSVHLLAGALLILLLSVPAFSQGNTGRILGTVTDQSGGVVAGATVTVLDTQRGVSRTLITDEAGQYNAPNLTAGTYTVRAEAKGFKKLERQNVVLDIGREVRIDLTVQPGEQEQTVMVTESVPLVETTNATLGGTINTQQVSDLPLNGRNYQNLVNLRPGVQIYPGGGPWTQSTNGVRPDEMAYMVDGVINANFFDARPIANMPNPFADGATIMPVDAIQNLDLEISPKAEYGWKPGATLNVGVKSGTNSIHGSAYAFGRQDAWDARNFFNVPLASDGSCAVGLPAACNKTPAQLEQFGAVVGGPIKKDKIFFFGGYEGLRSLIGNAFGGFTPGSQAFATTNPKSSLVDAISTLQAHGIARSAVSEKLMGCTEGPPITCGGAGDVVQNGPTTNANYLSAFPNTGTSDNGVGKIDYHINDKNTLNGMLFIGNDVAFGEDHPLVSATFLHPAVIRVWTSVEDWIWTPSSTVVNEVRFGLDRMSFFFGSGDNAIRSDGTGYPINTGITNPLLGGLPTISVQGFDVLGGWNNRPQNQSPNPYYDFQDSLSWLKGKHSLKFGVELTHIEADSAVYNQGRGQIYFQGGQTPGLTDCGGISCPLEDFLAGNPNKANLLAGNASRTLKWMSYAAFAQDDYRITPKLTLNLGLRYEYRSPMVESNGLFGNFDPVLGLVQQGEVGGPSTMWKPDHGNFGPRLGFAWDVTGRGTTVVRGGGSVMYTTMVGAWFTSQFGLQNIGSTSLASVPTGACNVVVPVGETCTGAGGQTLTPGGTITLTSIKLLGNNLNWDPTVNPNPALNGGTVFPTGVTPSCTAANACSIMAVDPNLKTPYVASWNIGIQHAFTSNLSLEVGYVGNRGERLLGFRDINQPDIAGGSSTLPYAGKFPYLGFINYQSNDAHSKYNSLQATLTQRTTHGLSFVAGYTYAHGLDNGSLNRFGLLPQDSYNPGAEYSSSDFDIRHRFTLTTSYNIPGIKGFGQLLEGWQLNSIVTIQTGQPWTIFDTGNNFSGSGESADRWDFFGNPSDFTSGKESIPYCTGPGPNDCVQTSVYGTVPVANVYSKCTTIQSAHPLTTTLAGGCFVSGDSVMIGPANGFGTMGRNMFRDAGFRNWDVSIFKNFTFKERYGVQFRAEFFNVLNHPNIGNPYGSANGWNTGIDPSAGAGLGYSGATPDGSAGNALVGSGSARDIQFGLKLTF